MLIDPMVQQQTGHRRRDEGHHQVAQQAESRGILAQQSEADAQQLRPVQQADRENRSELDHHRIGIRGKLEGERFTRRVSGGGFLEPEGLPVRVGQGSLRIEMHRMVGNDQVAGGGNGQEFRHALDEAENDGVARAELSGRLPSTRASAAGGEHDQDFRVIAPWRR